ncbi:ABC transporter permease [Streptomyces sp. OR43]|uniref:ABC transporter permease n=1 Tax=Streptomyces sp. or43 TaxID=2478957 RepID=UPI0029059D16|nr:ABC transporter permease [Streptomyces sp. or43]
MASSRSWAEVEAGTNRCRCRVGPFLKQADPLALTWLAVIPGLSASSVEGAGAFAYPLIFLPFVSSACVPTETMPGPVRRFAEHQPVTSIVNTIRNLFAQQPVGDDIWTALVWCVGILVVAYVFAMTAYRRKIA